MRPTRTLLSALLALAWLLVTGIAAAHAIGLSRGVYAARGSSVVGTLTFARAEIARLLPELDANLDGHVSALEVAAARDALRAKVLDRVRVTSGGPCSAALADAGLTEEDGLVVRGTWSCPPSREPFVIDLAFLDDLTPGHRHVLGDGVVLAGDERRFTLPRETVAVEPSPQPSPASPPMPLFGMGMEHILAGYDHLLFLFALVLVPTRARTLLAVVTAFTVAHSITLAIAVIGGWTPAARLVEPAIALSIAYVGIENIVVKDAPRRWPIAFAFGLVHGFGFAAALQAIALPHPVGALLVFNLGVEAGQLLVLAALVPLLFLLRRRRGFEARVVPILSGVVALVGGIWFVVRVFGGSVAR